MRYKEFEIIFTHARMSRYLLACHGNSKQAMTLYRKNLKLTQELFTVLSCFELALRNLIDEEAKKVLGNNWLRNGARTGGIFDNAACRLTARNINDAINNLTTYNHNKLIAELGFGFWRYMFARSQYRATGQIFLSIFPSKPSSTPTIQYNSNYIFNQLANINNLRNRMAHHEPICFEPQQPIKDTLYARQHYNLILQLFQWMQINELSLLYGLDHIDRVCDEIDNL
ncbi:MAG: CAAX protease [Bacteroidetes bacterium]|nr:CAAX protease [Bacteroidota bacterium]NOG57767.1 CAAX protease [Bacteroidota bacterium]